MVKIHARNIRVGAATLAHKPGDDSGAATDVEHSVARLWLHAIQEIFRPRPKDGRHQQAFEHFGKAGRAHRARVEVGPSPVGWNVLSEGLFPKNSMCGAVRTFAAQGINARNVTYRVAGLGDAKNE